MWRPSLNFIILHYTWVIFMGLLSLVILYPFGNLKAIDAYFFGVSASTESGLNTIDIYILPFYQQFYIYVTPIITSLGFVNIFAVVVRLYWFEEKIAASYLNPVRLSSNRDVEAGVTPAHNSSSGRDVSFRSAGTTSNLPGEASRLASQVTLNEAQGHESSQGKPFVEKDEAVPDTEDDENTKEITPGTGQTGPSRRKPYNIQATVLAARNSAPYVIEARFVPGRVSSAHGGSPQSRVPGLSRLLTLGRNPRFNAMTKLERERLGGIEYRSLKLLLKVVAGYFFGIHLLGVIFLLPWIHRAPARYTEHLAGFGIDKTWWAFYSSQTMISNLGLTLTPDSMIFIQDSAWPLLVMTFLTYAGNTCYPVFLRFLLWAMSKLAPRSSSPTRESLAFLLDHPRRCYTLLFPSRPTWVLLGINFVLNFVDVALMVVLDLDNPQLNHLALGPRIVCAIFQTGSSRHTGSSTLELADISPATQFSLLVMMYIAALPIAVNVRANNNSSEYEDRSLGLYRREKEPDERNVKTYLASHVGNQLDFDLWYIFLATFLICAVESKRVADPADLAFSVFAILFEVVSAYCNVGLSLGHPAVTTSLAGEFKTVSKLVVCAAMIRGRHRCLPYALDKAVVLPGEEVGVMIN